LTNKGITRHNKRSIKCGYAPISSGQAVFVETFENFKYIYR